MTELDVETAGSVGQTRFKRWLAILVGVTALAAALLATLEADAGRREERAFVRGSRLSLDIFENVAGSGPRNSFQARGVETSLALGAEATARFLAADGDLDPLDLGRALADQAAADRIPGIVERMAAVPGPESDLDAHTREVLASTPAQLQSIVEDQNAAIDAAERFGTRQDRSIFALSLAAIAAVLLGLAGVIGEGRAGRIVLVTAALALLLAMGWGASALPV